VYCLVGRPAKLTEDIHPDWVPSLNLGYSKKTVENIDRYERQKKRQPLLEVEDARTNSKSYSELRVETSKCITVCVQR